ncbi:hypothetical protein AB0M45_09275 [Nocardia sp. NPDC051787]|uniref:hypothetical protein n=1 Tax=Nocardia sp. NPDC051787 TaxID=3155415 RepID=UPI003438797A
MPPTYSLPKGIAMSEWHITITRRDDQLEEIRRTQMAQQEIIEALVAQLDNARGEIVSEIQRLEDLVASGGGEQLDFTMLRQRVQALDDVVTDAPGGEEPQNPEDPGTAEPAPAPGTDPGTVA